MLILEQIVGNIASLSKAAFRKIVQKVFQKTPTQAHPVIHNMSVTYRYRIVIVSKSPIPKKILMHKEVCKNLASSIHGKVLATTLVLPLQLQRRNKLIKRHESFN